MNVPYREALQKICGLLNEFAVEYLTIGGAAVSLLGFDRWSTNTSGKQAKVVDLDFWYNPTYDNYFKLLNVLEKLGQDVEPFRKEKTPDPKHSFFRLDRPEFTVDFLPVVPALPRFREAFNARETAQLDNVEVSVIGYEHLIKNKQALGRLKDIEDIRQLQQKKQAQKPRQRRPRQRPG
jgi:hypothetical protein